MSTIKFLSDNSYILIFAAMPLFIAGQVYFLVRRMSEPEKMFQTLAGPLAPYKETGLLEFKDWLHVNNFHQIGSYRFGAIDTVTFKQEGSQRFFPSTFTNA